MISNSVLTSDHLFSIEHKANIWRYKEEEKEREVAGSNKN